MSEEGQPQKKRSVKKGNSEDDMPMECEGDTDNENIIKDKMDGNKRSSPRRKYLRETGSGALEKIDKKGKNKGDDDSSEEAEAGDEVKSKLSQSEDEEYVPEPPAKKRRLVRSAQENVPSGENSQGKKSKPKKGKKGVRRAPKRITPKKKSKASKKKAKAEQDEGEYEVEKIVQVKILRNGKKEFLIRWKGFSEEHDTWEPEANLTCKELVNQYFEEHKEEIEAPVEEDKKTVKGKSKRRGSSTPRRPKKTDSATVAEGGAKENAKKGKGKSKQSQSKGKQRQTRARSTAAKSGKDESALSVTDRRGDAKAKKAAKDQDKDTTQNAGNSPDAEETAEHSGTSESEDRKEYEVEKIVDVRQVNEGNREFLIKWRGYPERFNSWESENNMNCSEKIEKFLRSMEEGPTERELRAVRKKTNRFEADGGGRGRKLSLRLGKMPRKSYSELD